MESLAAWAAEDGRVVEPYGVEISARLADLARARLPHWADRIWTGNAMTWVPPRRFDVVRTGLDYVPPRRRAEFVERLLDEVVAPGGRLVVGVFNEEKDRETRRRHAALVGPPRRGRHLPRPPRPAAALQGGLGRRLTSSVDLEVAEASGPAMSFARRRPVRIDP